MTKKKRGRIIILSGPSGSGKTTLYKRLLKRGKLKGRLVKSVSMTTRAPRSGEKDGRDYWFVSRKMFLHKKRAGHLLESQKVFDNDYGTPQSQVRDFLKQGKHVLLCIDVKGARVVSRKFPDAVKIFIKTPSLTELKNRLVQRGSESQQTIHLRLNTARQELKEEKNYHYSVVNGHLETACNKLESIMLSIFKN